MEHVAPPDPIRRARPGVSGASRLSWTSAAARATWAPRFDAAGAAWRELQARAVASGVCDAAMISVDNSALGAASTRWEAQGLDWAPLEVALRLNAAARPEAGPLMLLIGLMRNGRRDAFIEAWRGGSSYDQQRWLGAPACCAEAAARASRHAVTDPLWLMALATHASTRPQRRLIICEGPSLCNVLLRPLGIRPVAHLPCRLDCAASAAHGARLQTLGEELDCREALGWSTQILRWPMEWSAWHGLAEIRTPVCRIVGPTDYSQHRYIVRLCGPEWPQHGANGLAFPYRNADMRRLTNATGFRRGLKAGMASDAES